MKMSMTENEIVTKGSSLYPYRLVPQPLSSSIGLGWRGLVVERYQVKPCELPDLPAAHHTVEFASQQHVSLGERPDWRGHLRRFSKYPGTCCFFPAGVRRKLRLFTQTSLIVCGLDPMSVVDANLRGYGIEKLRIADGSIMPRVTTGNTMAPCVIIGERAAELLRAAHRLS
jgi:hypothetical protein